jgi:thiamine phosphate synthase YjbQ (UPF0047 family)
MLNRLIPKDIEHKHDETWHDGNGHSHVRSLVGPSLTVPFKDRNFMNSLMTSTESISDFFPNSIIVSL